MANGLATWWDNLHPNQQQSVIIAAFFLALTWAIGGLLIYAIRDANRKADAKKAASQQEEVSWPISTTIFVHQGRVSISFCILFTDARRLSQPVAKMQRTSGIQPQYSNKCCFWRCSQQVLLQQDSHGGQHHEAIGCRQASGADRQQRRRQRLQQRRLTTALEEGKAAVERCAQHCLPLRAPLHRSSLSAHCPSGQQCITCRSANSACAPCTHEGPPLLRAGCRC